MGHHLKISGKYGTFLRQKYVELRPLFWSLKIRPHKCPISRKNMIYLKFGIFLTILIILKLCILTETGFAATLKNVVQVDGVTPWVGVRHFYGTHVFLIHTVFTYFQYGTYSIHLFLIHLLFT
jgi:hypothetical protein